MIADIADRHFKDYARHPEVVEVIPGVVKFAGGFAGCCKGLVLCACKENGLAVSISQRPDSSVRITNALYNDHKRFNTGTFKFRREDRWGNYVKGVFAGIIGEGMTLTGLNIVLDGPVLSGDGESVASAVGVCVCMALNRMFNLGLDRNAIARIVYISCTQFCQERCSYASILTILDKHNGCYAVFDLLRMNCIWIPDPFSEECAYSIVLIDAGIPASAMRDETQMCCDAVSQAVSRLKSWCGCTVRDLSEDELRGRSNPLGETDRRLCAYVLGEYRCVMQIQKALESGDCAGFGKNLMKIARLTGTNLELSCPEIDWIIKRCSELSGCCGACMVYGYSGSNVAAVVRTDALDALKEKLDDYEHIFGFRYKMEAFHPIRLPEL